MEKSIHEHRFTFNKTENGGEEISLRTEFHHNQGKIPRDDDPQHAIFWNQFLTLQSYGNSASLNLYSAVFSPENLRELANQLERAQIQAEEIVRKKIELAVRQSSQPKRLGEKDAAMP